MTRFSKAPRAPEFKPKAPKPKLTNYSPLKEANKPKPLKAAEKAKAKTAAKTLKKLPGGKKNPGKAPKVVRMGKGEVFHVKGKAPKVVRMGKGEVFNVKGKAPKVVRMGKGEVFNAEGTADNFTNPKLEKLAKQFKFQEKVIKPLSMVLKGIQNGNINTGQIKNKLEKSLASLTEFMLVSGAPKFIKTITAGKIDMRIQQKEGKATMTIIKDKQENKFVENNKLVIKATALAKLSTPPAKVAHREGGAGDEVMDI